MSVYDKTMAAIAADARVAVLLAAISPGDKSILYMLLDRQEGFAVTAEGSANDPFWACLAEHGWMELVDRHEMVDPEAKRSVIPDAAVLLTAARMGREGSTAAFPGFHYRLTEAGRRAIPVVLARLIST